MIEPIGVDIIVLDKTKKKLLMGIRKNSYGSGALGLPGGRLELDELLEECARRELLEEVGITAKSLKALGVVRDFQKDHNFVHFGFLCEEFNGEVGSMEPEKCAGWEWFPLDKLPANILPGHDQIIDIYLKNDFPLRDYIERKTT
jgi:8-oxo-dGTP diphosphatase